MSNFILNSLIPGRCGRNLKLEQLERLRSEIPPAAPWLPILVIHIRSQVKTRQSHKFLKIAKISYFAILQETLHATHLLKLLYKMHKYEMDLTRTVEATERTRDVGRTRDRRGTDGQTDGRSETNIPPQQLRCAGGIISNFQTHVKGRYLEHF